MKEQPDYEGKRWFAEGEEDLAVAKVLCQSEHYSHACFHAQQAAEKVVKAFLYTNGVEDPWGHSVSKLIADAKSYATSFEKYAPLAAQLDRFYIPTRYPNGLPGGLPSESYFKEDAEVAIEHAKTIITATKEYI